jgi:hypothetical protein
VGFSQRLSRDHLVLELDENEGGLVDVADFSGADRDVLEGPPALGHQGEAPLAQASKRAQQRVTGPGIQIKFPAACWLPDRGMNAVACSFVPGVGQHGQILEAGPRDGEHVLAGGGDVVGAARQDRGDP